MKNILKSFVVCFALLMTFSFNTFAQKQVRDEYITIKNIVGGYDDKPLAVEYIKGARFNINGIQYLQEDNMYLREENDYTAILTNENNFIKLVYNKENGELYVFCDVAQPACDISVSKSPNADIVGYLITKDHYVSKERSKVFEDIPVLLYKEDKDRKNELSVGGITKQTLTIKDMKGVPAKEEDIEYIEYICPDEVRLRPNGENLGFKTEYDERLGELSTTYTNDKTCYPIAVSVYNYDTVLKSQTGNDFVVYPNDIIVQVGTLENGQFIPKQNALKDISYKLSGEDYLPLHQKANEWRTERLDTNTTLTIRVNLIDDYEVVSMNGADVELSSTYSFTTRVKEYAKEDRGANTYKIIIREKRLSSFFDTYRVYIYIASALVSCIIIISFILLIKKISRGAKKGTPSKKELRKSKYEEMFEQKADWED